MIKSLLIIFFCSLPLIAIQAQMSNHDFGSKSMGVGNSNSTLTDEWSIFNNVGGISGVENGMVFFGYNRFTSIEGFDKVAAGIIQPFDFGNIGISLFNFGDDLFSERIASVAYGNKVGFVRLGVRASYYQMSIEEFGTAGTFFFDLGGIVELMPKMTFGAYISNFSLSHLSNSEKSELPVIMKLGFDFRPINELRLSLDIFKDVDYKPVIKAGLEYLIISKVYLRTGINTNPFKNYFGGGLLLKRFKIDYALSNHDYLGISHQATISYSYLKKNEN